MPQDVLLVESVPQAAVLLKPLRIAMLREMTEPRSCPELAATFEQTPQKIYYHVKTMQQAGLIERAGERSVNGIREGFYRARSRSYWLSPRLVGALGGRRTVRDQSSLRMLAGHAEEMLEDVGRLGELSTSGQHVPSLSLAVDVDLPTSERRGAFLAELRSSFQDIARRYAADAELSETSPDATRIGQTFRFTLACYPKTTAQTE
jgi:Helix-turn-helix domain